CPSVSATLLSAFFTRLPPPPRSPLFPYTTLFRSRVVTLRLGPADPPDAAGTQPRRPAGCEEDQPDEQQRRTEPQQHPLQERGARSEEHTSELQSPYDLVCRLLLEKKKEKNKKQ